MKGFRQGIVENEVLQRCGAGGIFPPEAPARPSGGDPPPAENP